MSDHFIINDIKAEVQTICAEAAKGFETEFFSSKIVSKLRRTIREQVKTIEFGLSERWSMIFNGGDVNVTEAFFSRLSGRMEKILQEHVESCRNQYIKTINTECSAMLERRIAHSGHRLPADFTTSGGVHIPLKPFQISALGFYPEAPEWVALMLTAVTGSSQTIQEKVAGQLISEITDPGPKGFLQRIWRKQIQPRLATAADTIWTGSSAAPGIAKIADSFLAKRATRTFGARVPSWLGDALGEEHAVLYNQLKADWMQIPRVAEDAFVIAVAGPTSAGKSTLLNRLLGYAVLEECFAQHTTPCPILLSAEGDSRPTCTMRAYRHGYKSPFATEAMPLPPPPNDAANDLQEGAMNRLFLQSRESFWDPVRACATLQRIEMELPSPLLANGLVLVDLPGVEGYFEGDKHKLATVLTDISKVWLARADAAIFVFAPEQVRRANVCRFVGDFSQTGRPLAVFISMCDKLSPQELNCHGAEATRTMLAERQILPFMEANEVRSIGPSNVFLGAARLDGDTWAKRETPRALQALALADTARLSDWIRQQSPQHKHEDRKQRQACADIETARQITRRFVDYIGTLATEPIPDSVDLFAAESPALHGIKKRVLSSLVKARNRLLGAEFMIPCK